MGNAAASCNLAKNRDNVKNNHFDYKAKLGESIIDFLVQKYSINISLWEAVDYTNLTVMEKR